MKSLVPEGIRICGVWGFAPTTTYTSLLRARGFSITLLGVERASLAA